MTRTLVIIVLALIAASIPLAVKIQAHPSWGIAVDHHGQVYFSNLKTIWKIDAQGRLSAFRAGNDHTHELNIDEAGNLYGAENSYDSSTQRFYSAIWKMTPSGDFKYLLAPTIDPPEGTSIWKDGDGNSYHVSYFPEGELLVLKRTPKGNITALVGSGSAARAYRQSMPYGAGGIAFGTDGALYFIHGTNASKLTAGGRLIPLVRNLVVENDSSNPARGSSLFGIAVDAQGNVFVADYGNRRILKIAPDNRMTTLIRAEESWFPTGIAIRGGAFYILEESHTPAHKPLGTRVRKLSPGGTVTVLATIGENGIPSGNPPVGEASSGENSVETAKPKQNFPYALLGAGISFVALPLIVWLVWRRMDDNQHENT